MKTILGSWRSLKESRRPFPEGTGSPVPSAAGREGFLRRGQTVVEYLLVTVALTITFSTMYKVLQWYLVRQFRAGGVLILRMYKEQPW